MSDKGTTLTFTFDANGRATSYEGTYIYFIHVGDKPKTEIWEIQTKGDDYKLGEVSWFGRWRGYCFFPESGTVFEKTCLKEISEFLTELMELHRMSR